MTDRRSLIQDVFGIRVETIAIVDVGYDSEVAVVNGEWIFRFPRRAQVERRLETEIALLPELAPSLPVAIPRFEYLARDPVMCVGYRLIDGEPLTADVSPQQVAAFLAALHAFDVPRAEALGVPRPEWRAHYEEQCAANGTNGFILIPPARVVNVFVDEEPDRAWDELGEHFLAEARLYAHWQTQEVSSPVTSHASTAAELRAEGIYAVLTPQECIDRIRGGAGTMLLHPLCGGIPVARGWDCLRLYAERVLPAVS